MHPTPGGPPGTLVPMGVPVTHNPETASLEVCGSTQGFLTPVPATRCGGMRGRLTARLLAAAQIQDGENVLDVGCGCGDVTILAARATPSGPA